MEPNVAVESIYQRWQNTDNSSDSDDVSSL